MTIRVAVFLYALVGVLLNSLVVALAQPTTTQNVSVPYENVPTSQGCWGYYSIDTDYYKEGPRTGVIREYWLVVENITMAPPDGYLQNVMAINRSIPGPAIEANWGDEVVVHVTNLLEDNGTTIHFHGIRQLNNNVYDGVPGVTQSPIAPGQSFTYRWVAEQYGTSWYHAHYSLQYSVGLRGPMIIHGPATADYDEDLGTVVLQDWSHVSPFAMWWYARLPTGPLSLASALINGKNAFDCAGSGDPACLGNGTRAEWHFEAGKRYRMRIVNTGLYANFRFAIDGHNLTVIASDLVPIAPYTTDNVAISMGQRYDVVVEASAATDPDNYWLRAIWQTTCCPNDYANNTLGIIRYDNASTALPTTTSPALGYPDNCGDEPPENLVPYLPWTAGPAAQTDVFDLSDDPALPLPKGFMWTLNGTYMWANFSAPTDRLLALGTDAAVLPTDYLAYTTPSAPGAWVYVVFNDVSERNRSHPMHLHGHDYLLLGAGDGRFDPATSPPLLRLDNPPRRDTASWPARGWMALALRADSPGAWLLHCHIAWHSSQGLGVQVLERPADMRFAPGDVEVMDRVCRAWDEFWEDGSEHIQEDAGI